MLLEDTLAAVWRAEYSKTSDPRMLERAEGCEGQAAAMRRALRGTALDSEGLASLTFGLAPTIPEPDDLEGWSEVMGKAGNRGRGPVALGLAHLMSPAVYWRCVRWAWLDCERSPLSHAHWRQLFNAGASGRHDLMTPEERDRLASLPERVTIYRGVGSRSAPIGLSWTLDPEMAEFFASTYRHVDGGPETWVREETVLRRRIIALIDERDESEVLVWPRHTYRRPGQ